METSRKSKEMVDCGHCGTTLRHKHFEEHLYRRHPGKAREYAASEEHACQLRKNWESEERKRKEEKAKLQVEKEKLKLKARQKQKQEELAAERDKILLRRKQAEEQEKLEKLKKLERKRKQSVSRKCEVACGNEFRTSSTPANMHFVGLDHDYYHPSKSQKTDMMTGKTDAGAVTACMGSIKSQSTVTLSQPLVPGPTDATSGQYTFSHSTPSRRSHNKDDRICERVTTAAIHEIDEEKMRKNFRVCKSLEDIKKHAQIFEYSDDDKSFDCIACRDYQTGAKISYVSETTDSESMKLIKIRELKKKLLVHMYSSSRHLSAVRAIHDACNTEHVLKTNANDDDYSAGMTVGRAAYGCIKKGRSYQDFEMDMCMRAADNSTIGDINHSASFASSMTKCFHDEILSRMQKKLQRPLLGTGDPPPFSIVCDKMTPSRQTLHTIGIVSPIDNGRLHATYLEARPSTDGTGIGLAREVNTAMRRVFSADDVRSRFRGMAVDGAYINCNIKEHVLDALEIPQGAHESYAVHWDPAHQLELAGKASRRQDGKTGRIGEEWIRSTVSTVNQLALKYGRGKGWNELNESHILNQCQDDASGSEMPTARIAKLQNFSTTRFTSFAHRAISAVRKNWANLYDCVKNNDDKLCLTNPKFILHLFGLDDVYSTIGKTSVYLQSSRIYPWNVAERLDDCFQNLHDMTEQLSTDFLDSTKFPALLDATAELKSHGTYKGRQLQGHKNGGESFEGDILQVKKDLAENIQSFVQDLSRRHEKSSEKVTQLTREVFSLRKIQQRPPGDVPSAVMDLHDMYRSSSFVAEVKSQAEIQDEYRAFLNAVYLESERNFNPKGEFISKEEQIYAKFLAESEPAKDSRTIARMLASASCQTQCEAVTEGWGSVVDSLAKRKINLVPEKLSQETFIKLNGPPPSSQSNGIIEGALDRHFGGRHRWHFIRSSRHVQTKGTSRVVSRLSTTKEGFSLDD